MISKTILLKLNEFCFSKSQMLIAFFMEKRRCSLPPHDKSSIFELFLKYSENNFNYDYNSYYINQHI